VDLDLSALTVTVTHGDTGPRLMIEAGGQSMTLAPRSTHPGVVDLAVAAVDDAVEHLILLGDLLRTARGDRYPLAEVDREPQASPPVTAVG
jgi:hypothetical protein